MRYLTCLVVAVLLPNLALLQIAKDFDPASKAWLANILKDHFNNETGNKGAPTIDKDTLSWLQPNIKLNGTTSSTEATPNTIVEPVTKYPMQVRNQTVLNKYGWNDTDPILDQDFSGAPTIDKGTLSWLQQNIKLNGTTSSTEATPNTIVEPVTKSPMQDRNQTVLNKYGWNDTDPILDQDFSDSDKCVTDDGRDGICVSYFQCDSQGLIDNTTLIDLREKSCPHYLQKCCLQSEASKKPKNIEPSSSQCGWSNPGASIFREKNQDNINRKTYADYGEFPWMVALIKKGGSEGSWSKRNYLGGGSIIHTSVVITAAHKVDQYSPNEIKCRAGEWDTQTDLELYRYQEQDVKRIITHEEFYRTPAYNDVSLLILEKPFDLSDAPHIGVACLAPQLPTPGTQCFSMGWGAEFQQKNENAVILKKVKLPYVLSNQCEAILKTTRLSSRYTLHASHLCAGGIAGADTCKGDGGSSLVCPIIEGAVNTRFAVYGMVAFGVGCGTPVPAVYVNVPYLYSWVGHKMAAEGLDASTYKY